jgi:hypothetical protein
MKDEESRLDVETKLRTQLFNRTSRRIALTDAGHPFPVSVRRFPDDVPVLSFKINVPPKDRI